MERGNVFLGDGAPFRSKRVTLLSAADGNFALMRIRRLVSGGFLRDMANAMRRRPTPAERRAWELLRDRRCLGLKFRRQHVMAGYILDFYCADLRLALEVDGPVHDDPLQRWRDTTRTAALEGAGVHVVRIPNAELSAHRLEELLHPFTREPAQRSPSPYHGEGDRG